LHALDGDADLNGDGYMTASELSIYLRDNVMKRSHGINNPQYGRINNSGNNPGNFVFLLEPLEPVLIKENNNNTKKRRPVKESPAYRYDINYNPVLPDFNFTYIPGGSFQMGSPPSEEGRDDDESPQFEVTVKQFNMQTTELTQFQWKQIMGYNPSCFKGDNLPVEQVSWNDIQAFLRRLNRIDPGKHYRLPSEAEWEYACRAGSNTRFPWGDDNEYAALDLFSWTIVGYTGQTYPVGQKLPNAWGLYDMHGNVYEWCEDWYHRSYAGAPVDGSAWLSPVGSQRIYRGGGSVIQEWGYNARRCRSAYRSRGRPTIRYDDLGFRLVREVE